MKGEENMDMIHLKPEEAFVPSSPESKELENVQKIEFVINPGTGKIEKVGDPRDVRQWIEAKQAENPDFELENIKGGVAIPGMIDTHNHFLYGTLEFIGAGSVYGVNSSKEMNNAISGQAGEGDKENPKVILGHNTATVPDIWKDNLDQSSTDRPVCLLDNSFHGARLNSRMVALVKEAAERESSEGRVLTGSLDEKTGQATEDFALLAMEVSEAHAGVEKISEGMKGQLDKWIGQGITGIHEMYPLSYNDLVATLMARRDWEKKTGTEFPVRQIFMTPWIMKKLAASQKELERMGIFDPERDWEMIGVKLLADGSFGSHTALMEGPYGDGQGSGVLMDSPEKLKELQEMIKELGIDKVAMHAIGDAGIENALKTARLWKKIAEGAKLDPDRFRIEHFELSGKKLDQAKELGVWISIQPNFLTDYVYEDRLGKRTTQLCPHASMVNKGIPMMFGSDGMPASAMFGIWAATHHPNPKERIPIQQALAAYSLIGADYEHDGQRGRLAEGCSADIVVMNRDAFAKLLPGEGDPKEFANLGQSDSALSSKVSSLESGISRIYRQGKLVSKK